MRPSSVTASKWKALAWVSPLFRGNGVKITAAIDVLLPYYGDVDRMKQAVRSVLGQTYQAWRLVVNDDGYPDPEPARWFAGLSDERVSYQVNERNLGANGNYRKCLTLAIAPHLIVMGADDVMLPRHLDLVMELFTTYRDAAVVQTGVEVIDQYDRVVRPIGDRIKAYYAPSARSRPVLTGEDLAVSLLRGNWTYFPSLGWRTASIQSIGFRTGLDVAQDLALLLDVAVAGGGLAYESRPTFQYRRHSGQDSSVRALDGRRFDEERRFFAQEAKRLDGLGWDRAARVARWHLSSRLNALTLVPRAIRVSGWRAASRLGRHVVE